MKLLRISSKENLHIGQEEPSTPHIYHLSRLMNRYINKYLHKKP